METMHDEAEKTNNALKFSRKEVAFLASRFNRMNKNYLYKAVIAAFIVGFAAGFACNLLQGHKQALPATSGLLSTPYILAIESEPTASQWANCTDDQNCMDIIAIDDLPRRDIGCDTDADCVQKTGLDF